jgi:hypothetical protein
MGIHHRGTETQKNEPDGELWFSERLNTPRTRKANEKGTRVFDWNR